MKDTNIRTPRTSEECRFIPSDDPFEYGESDVDTADLIVGIGSLILLAIVASLVLAKVIPL